MLHNAQNHIIKKRFDKPKTTLAQPLSQKILILIVYPDYFARSFGNFAQCLLQQRLFGLSYRFGRNRFFRFFDRHRNNVFLCFQDLWKCSSDRFEFLPCPDAARRRVVSFRRCFAFQNYRRFLDDSARGFTAEIQNRNILFHLGGFHLFNFFNIARYRNILSPRT